MVDYDNVCYNLAAFIGGLFMLEFGADKFVDHTVKVASRLGVSPTLIALLTAGAEWEELVVVVAAISQHRSTLALGNILGSSISNVLGAFSLGLIFSPINVEFDHSSKIYTGLLLALTSAFVVILAFFKSLGRIGGGILIATFAIYVASIAYCIYKGMLSAPEDDDDDDDDDSDDGDSDSDTSDDDETSQCPSSTSTLRDEEAAHHEVLGLANADKIHLKSLSQRVQVERGRPRRSFAYHLTQLTLGFLALSLSGYVLSHSVSTLADTFSLSGNLVGITVLSIATTLPEKLVAVFSGARRQGGIVVANTVGSNIFLFTLCTGVLLLAGDLEMLKGNIKVLDLAALWLSSLLLFVVVMVGGRKWMGWALLGLYVGFIFLEFMVERL